MKKIVAIVQARMSSTRLPRKILLPLGDKSVLAHVVDRLRMCSNIDEIVVATTTLDADNATVEECSNIGVTCFRGSSDNVLERYYLAAKMVNADVVIRVTSDCPFIDPELTDLMINEFQKRSVDYFSNTIERTFPRGLDVEIFTFKTLEKSYNSATQDYEREHVTPYVYRNPDLFKIEQYISEQDNSNLRLTLDTDEDWELISKVYSKLYKENGIFLYADILSLFRQQPELSEINAHIEQKKVGSV